MLEATDIKKIYGTKKTSLTVIDGLHFKYSKGENTAIYGASGSGKSTFLHIIGGLDKPTDGEVVYNGENIYRFNEKRLAGYRNSEVGFVFQFYHLLSEFSAVENVMIPCLISGMSKRESKEKAVESLAKVGLEDRLSHRPSELSGGEQQRAAIARAIVMRPRILLADEPTGNLDKATGNEILAFLSELSKNENMGIVMVTHDPSLAERMDRILELRDGKLHQA